MRYQNFKQLYKEVSILDGQKKNREALNLLEGSLIDLPEAEYRNHFMEIEFTKAVLSYKSGLDEKYLQIITKLLDRGYAYPEKYLKIMPVEDERFILLKEKNKDLLVRAQKKAKSCMQVYLPAGYSAVKKYSLLIACHGNGGNIHEFQEYWKPDLFQKEDFICVYLQSSQVWWHGSYGWTQDLELTRQELLDGYQLITENYFIDSDRVLVGGFSGGAIASLDATMMNVIPVKGVIALCPGAKPDSFTLEAVQAAAQRGLKSVIMEGALLVPVLHQEEMLALYKKAGVGFRYVINEGIGHWFPDDFEAKFAEALDFIIS